MFSERIKKGQSWENEVIEILKERGFIVMKHGYEYTHKEIQSILVNCEDFNSKFVRYKPDHIAIKDNHSIFFEPKTGDSIEKDAFIISSKLHEIGCKVILFIMNKKLEKFEVPIENLLLISGLETINSYPSHWLKIPVDNEDWISPRILLNKNPNLYYQWKQITRGSGTAYRYFDFKNMEKYKLKEMIEVDI